MSAADRVSIASLAHESQLDGHTVRDQLSAAGLRAGADGKFDRAEALAVLAANVDPARVAGHSASGRGAVASAETSRLSNSRAKAEDWRARKIELEVKVKEGLFVSRTDVTAAGAHICASARQAFLAIGRKLGPRLAGETDANVIAHMIEDEARAALGVLVSDETFLAEVLA